MCRKVKVAKFAVTTRTGTILFQHRFVFHWSTKIAKKNPTYYKTSSNITTTMILYQQGYSYQEQCQFNSLPSLVPSGFGGSLHSCHPAGIKMYIMWLINRSITTRQKSSSWKILGSREGSCNYWVPSWLCQVTRLDCQWNSTMSHERCLLANEIVLVLFKTADQTLFDMKEWGLGMRLEV